MEKSQVAPDIPTAKLADVEAKPLKGEKAEYNVPDIKNEPVQNTYANSGLHLDRRIGMMMDDLGNDSHSRIRKPPILLKARSFLSGDHFKTSDRMAHHDHKMYKRRDGLFE
jgi:hypothetical protein